MAISQAALEEAVLTLLCFNKEQAPLLALKIQDAKIFSNRTNQKIVTTCLEYISQYGTAPGTQLEYLLEADFRRGEEGKLLAQTFDLLSKQAAQVQPDFIIKELDSFLELRKLSNSLKEALEACEVGDIDAARDAMYKQSAPSINGSSGIWLKDPAQAFRFMDKKEQNEFFTTGIPLLDERGATLERKTMSLMLASTGKGKSWWLVEVGKGGLQHHHKVLHITLELSEEITAQRYLQSIFSLTKNEVEKLTVPMFEKDAEGNTTIQFRELERDSIFDKGKRKQIEARLASMGSYPDLLIKEFPTGSLTIEHLALYMDSLEQEKGFVADLLILDYADLMKLNSESLRTDTGRLYKELRGLVVTRNQALASATQGNRDSETAKVVGLTNMGEDWSKNQTADNVFTYSQTVEEYRLGLARIFAAKCRNAQDKFLALISQSYRIGQFCIDSMPMNMGMVSQIDSLKESAAAGGK